MKYRVEMGHDGFPVYIPVPDDASGPAVYNVGTGSDGELTHTPTDDEKTPQITTPTPDST